MIVTPKLYQYNDSDSETPVSPIIGRNKLSQARSSTTSQLDWAYPAPSPIFGKGMSSPDVTSSSSESSESGSESDTSISSVSSISSSMSDYGASKPHVSIRGPCLTIATPLATRPLPQGPPRLGQSPGQPIRRRPDEGDDEGRPSSARRALGSGGYGGGYGGGSFQKAGRSAGPAPLPQQQQQQQQQSSVPSSPQQQQLRPVPIPITTQTQSQSLLQLRQSLPMPMPSPPHRYPVQRRLLPQYDARESESGSDSFAKPKQSASSPGCARVSCDPDGDSDEPCALIGHAITPTGYGPLRPIADRVSPVLSGSNGAAAMPRAATPSSSIVVDIDSGTGGTGGGGTGGAGCCAAPTAMTPCAVVVESYPGTSGSGVSSSYGSSESGSCSSAREPPRVVMNSEAALGKGAKSATAGSVTGKRRNSLSVITSVGVSERSAAAAAAATAAVVDVTRTRTITSSTTPVSPSATATAAGNRGDDENIYATVSPIGIECIDSSDKQKKKRRKKHRKKRDSVAAMANTFKSDVDSDAAVCCSPEIDSYPSSPSPDLE